MRKFVRFLQGFLIGGAIGVVLGLLFAPYPGEQLRSQMLSEARRIQEEVRQAADQRREELEQQLSALRAPRKASQE